MIGFQSELHAGHSMGGLLLRYAIGISFDPASRKVLGLEPSHFVTLATPHLGCDAEGVSQVRPELCVQPPQPPVFSARPTLLPLNKLVHRLVHRLASSPCHTANMAGVLPARSEAFLHKVYK
jgi:hypothetical protein